MTSVFIWIILIALLIFTIMMAIYAVMTLVGLIRARGVPYVPLTNSQLAFLNKEIRLSPNDNVVDLGCGEGRVLRLFEKQGVKNLIGYEINYWAVFLARLKNKLAGSRSEVVYKNFNQVDLSKYNVVFCYLFDFYLKRLKHKLARELKPGTKVVSFAFEVEGWEPTTIFKDGRYTIYVYEIK